MKRLSMIMMCLLAMLALGKDLRAQEVSVTLLPGWTWIAYTKAETMSIDEAFGDFEPMEGDQIKSKQKTSTYRNGRWRGTMSVFNPGLGYHYYSNREVPVTLVFGGNSTLVVTTAMPTNITTNGFTCGGEVTDEGNSTIIVRGLCWSTQPNPSIADPHTTDSYGTGDFSSVVEGLEMNTTYYVRAYVMTANGASYGNEYSFNTLYIPDWTNGVLSGLFSVSADQQVQFSKGNLQYIGSTAVPYWKFADNQWDYFGNNGQGSTNQNVDRDLFGWGTSGYSHGAVCYQPWSTSTNGSDYCAYGNSTYNLFDRTGKADWGYNPISNGGNQTNQWRSLKSTEWEYVFNTRSTITGIRYAKAIVNNVNGVILLPDNWDTAYYSLNNTNCNDAYFSCNCISSSQWNTLELHGAVFLPTAGQRCNTSIERNNQYGYYWTSSYRYNYSVYCVVFGNSVSPSSFLNRYYGASVRLVHNSVSQIYTVQATQNSIEGGTVTGGGDFVMDAPCTLTATANEGYVFVNWTENGVVVSTDAIYSFTVTGDRILVANYASSTPTYFIQVTPNPTQGGVITGDGSYNEGQSCTLIAIASTGYTFLGWTENGIQVSTNHSYTFTVSGNRTLTAQFQIQHFAITASANPPDGGNVIGAGNYSYGQSCEVSAIANNNYIFINWTDNGLDVSSDVTFSFTVTGNRNLVANFLSANAELPTVTTTPVTMDGNNIVSGGNIINNGGAPIIACGICYGVLPNPDLSSTYTHTVDGMAEGSFTSVIDISMSGTIYVRAYATNMVGTSYGDQIMVNIDYLKLPTFEYNGIIYVVAPDPQPNYNDYYSWNLANAYCENLTAYGYSDWRMPSIEELEMMYINRESIGGFVETPNIYVSYHSSSLCTSCTYTTSELHFRLRWWDGQRSTGLEGEYYGYAIGEYSHVRPIRSKTITLPSVTTSSVNNITETSATCGGNVVNNGGGAISMRGVCWSTSHTPTINDEHTNNGTGTGSYTSNITGLAPGTQYYVRAYAINSEGVSYGAEVSFTTIYSFIVTTNDVTSITQTSATCGGNITYGGGATVTARGVCWSTTNQHPTISDSHTSDGTGIGNFTSNINGLTQNTTYYVRAYAISSEGNVYYGSTVQFKTTKLSYRISEGGLVATSAGGYFYDSGGPDDHYSNNEHYIMTFKSNAGTGSKIQMTFTQFETESDVDYLVIYDGMDTSAPVIGTYSGYNSGDSPGTVTATNSDGALTFVWISDNTYMKSGWKAAISIVQ